MTSLFNRISDLIPPRPSYPLKSNSAEKAVDDYHQQIKNVCNLILDEYRFVKIRKILIIKLNFVLLEKYVWMI